MNIQISSHEQLLNENNSEALGYLHKRGLNENIIKDFKLGYVPWKNNFYSILLKDYSEEEISSTGLYYKSIKPMSSLIDLTQGSYFLQ